MIGIGPDTGGDGSPRVWAYGWNAAKALGYTMDRDREGLRVSGCGMDMGFHVVYSLSRVLYPDGFECIGEGCPSNDHSNGDRDYTPHLNGGKAPHEPGYVAHWHSNGGYALRQRWV